MKPPTAAIVVAANAVLVDLAVKVVLVPRTAHDRKAVAVRAVPALAEAGPVIEGSRAAARVVMIAVHAVKSVPRRSPCRR